LNKKLKNAIGNSFNFPDSQHKDEFFRQVGLSYTEKKQRTVPVFYRITAAAAAMVVGAGILGTLKIQTGSKFDDIVEKQPDVITSVSENITTQPAVTNISPTAQNANVTTSLSKIFSADIILSAAKTTNKHSGTSSHVQQGAVRKKTASIVSADVSTSINQNEVSAPDISSPTTPPTNTKTYDERNFSIKKISAFAASLLIASHTSQLPIFSEKNTDVFLEQMHNTSFNGELSNNNEKMKWLNQHEDILDLNNDGYYDIFDAYAYYRSFMTYTDEYADHKTDSPQVPEYIMDNYIKNGDLDLDGDLANDQDDLNLAIDYFFTNCDLIPEYFAPDYYYHCCSDDYTERDDMSIFKEGITEWNYSLICDKLLNDPLKDNYIAKFIFCLSDRSMRAYKSYPLFCDLIADNTLTTDINGDGDFTIEELYDIITYCKLKSSGNTELLNKNYSAEELEVLQKNNDIAYLYFSSADLYPNYYIAYFSERNQFDYFYADKMFYSDMRNGIGTDNTVSFIKEYMHYFIPEVSEPRCNFTKDDISEQFTEYYRKVKSGNIPEPDIDMNGVINFEDFIYADLLLNIYYAESKLNTDAISEQVKNNFFTNCDFNDNHMSGDLSDTVCIELYVVKELGIQEDEVVNEIAKYYKAHPEMDIYDYAHYDLPDSVAVADVLANDGDQAASTGIRSIKQFVSKIAIFKPRSGDANCDGIVDMSDVVAIINYIAYPDKYKLTDEGRYNADICYTGDGITLKDALLIQQRLLEVI
jgi:hypothetical protein